jgi:hypothetical protein
MKPETKTSTLKVIIGILSLAVIVLALEVNWELFMPRLDCSLPWSSKLIDNRCPRDGRNMWILRMP